MEFLEEENSFNNLANLNVRKEENYLKNEIKEKPVNKKIKDVGTKLQSFVFSKNQKDNFEKTK